MSPCNDSLQVPTCAVVSEYSPLFPYFADCQNCFRYVSTRTFYLIADSPDEARVWFYTLMVLSIVLFNKPQFKSLIVNELVLAADGKRMSGRLISYPVPTEVVNKHGAGLGSMLSASLSDGLRDGNNKQLHNLIDLSLPLRPRDLLPMM